MVLRPPGTLLMEKHDGTEHNARHKETSSPVHTTRANHPAWFARRSSPAGWSPLQPPAPDSSAHPVLERPAASTCAYHAVNAPSEQGDACSADHGRLDHVPRRPGADGLCGRCAESDPSHAPLDETNRRGGLCGAPRG